MRQQIIDQSFVLFSQEGYHGITINEISTNVGLKKSSFYNYFLGKDDLYRECIEKCFRDQITNFKKEDFDSKNSKSILFLLAKNYAFSNIEHVKFYFQLPLAPSRFLHDITQSGNEFKANLMERTKQLYQLLNLSISFEEFYLAVKTFINGWLALRYLYSPGNENKKIYKEFKVAFESFYNGLIK